MSFTNIEASKIPFLAAVDTNKKLIKRIATPSEFQVGLRNIRSALDLYGKLGIAPTTFISDNNNNGYLYPTNKDAIIAVTTSSAPISGRIKVFLPSTPTDGEIHFITDVFGGSDITPIDIVPQGATINSALSGTLSSPHSSIGVFFKEDAWYVFSSAGDVHLSSIATVDVSLITTNVPPRNLTTVVLCDASAGSFSQTLPDCSVTTYMLYFKKIDSSGLYITLVGSDSTQKIDGSATLSFNTQYTSVQIVGYKGNWWII